MSKRFREHQIDTLVSSEDYEIERELKKQARKLKETKMIKRRKARKAKRDYLEMMIEYGFGG